MTLRTLALFALAVSAQAHDVITTKVTWAKEISRLVYRRCAVCHSGEPGAFSLLTYEDARPWAKAIKEESGSRRMPPWQAVKGFGDFRNDRGLTQEEIELLSDWVEGGAPEGDPKYLPEKPRAGQWLDPDVRKGARRVAAPSGFRLKTAMRVAAVRPEGLAEGASAQAIARRPDGTVVPLIWIYRYNPKFARTYFFREAVALPAGTEIQGPALTLFGP